VILGCTHYPLIAHLVRATLKELGCNAEVVDSAQVTAEVVALQYSGAEPFPGLLRTPATFTCYATDSVEKFQRLGSHFLGQQIPQVHLLDLGG
jgi:glutamate racemase